jgi:hypothetical protein
MLVTYVLLYVVADHLPGILALRVVTPKTLEPPLGGIKFYVLTDQESASGLCNAYNIGQESVFYFSEYRTTNAKVSERKKQWNELVANFSVGHLAPSQSSSLRGPMGPAAIDDPAIAAATEILMISSAYLYADNNREFVRLKRPFVSDNNTLLPFMDLMDRFLSLDNGIANLSDPDAIQLA